MARLNLETFNKGNLVSEFKDGNTTIRFYDSSYLYRSKADYTHSCNNIGEICCRLAIEGKVKNVKAFRVKAKLVHKSNM